MISRIREIYRYRAMLWGLVMYDLRTRYKGSILGGCLRNFGPSRSEVRSYTLFA
jgi:hypothetical protein